MFEDSLLDYKGRGKTKSPATIALSFVLQTIALGIMILIPLIHTEALPQHRLTGFLVTPPPPPTPKPVPAADQKIRVELKAVQTSRELTQPTVMPEHAAILVEEQLPPGPVVGFVSEASGASQALTSFLGEPVRVVEPPPLLPERIPVGGLVMAAKLIHTPKPAYPPLARQARIQGLVRLKAIISKDGTIENLTVLSGHPLLIPAALDAVQQWRYQPTLLNGVPVEVETTIDVNFTLGR